MSKKKDGQKMLKKNMPTWKSSSPFDSKSLFQKLGPVSTILNKEGASSLPVHNHNVLIELHSHLQTINVNRQLQHSKYM